MTQPTQELPPYLSAQTITTAVGGSVATHVTLVEIPLTYFGPSIPLGTNGVWIFGGSTSPPPTTSTLSSSTVKPSSTIPPSAIPTSLTHSTTLLSSSLTLSSSRPVTTLFSTSSSFSNPVTSSSTPVTPTSNRLHRALPGIIIGSIAGLLLLLLLIFLFYRRCRPHKRSPYVQDNFSDYLVVGSEGQTRLAGEGTARPSGGEEDPFLRRVNALDFTTQAREALAERLINNPGPTGDWVLESDYAADEDGPAPVSPTTEPVREKHNSLLSLGDRSLFYDPAKGPDLTVTLHAEPSGDQKRDSASTQPSSGPSLPRGPIIPARQLLQLDDEWQKENAAQGPSRRVVREMGEHTPLRPPPALNPDGFGSSPLLNSQRNSATSQLSIPYADSPYSDPNESAAFLTAHRVNLNEGGPGTLFTVDPSSPTSGSGVGGLARLRRLSWLQRRDDSRQGTPQRRSLLDRELDNNSRPMSAVFGLGSFGERPLSHVSVQSMLSSTGNTVYHDALSMVSTRSGTPINSTRPTSPLRAHTPGIEHPLRHVASSSNVEQMEEQQSTEFRRNDGPSEVVIDVLDMPVPPPISPFSTTSSRGGPLLPPGLESLVPGRIWRDSGSYVPSAASIGTASAGFVGSGGTDLLEEEPPRPGVGWAHLRTSVGMDPGQRATLGQPVFINQYESRTSEQGSLHSMPTHLSPLSPLASGANSRAASRHGQYASSSYGSGSSHPSDRSHGRSGGSAYSLAHSNSISSDGRRRPRYDPGEPALPSQAAGYGRASLTATGRFSPAATATQRNPMYQGTFISSITGGTTTTVSDVSGESHITDSTAVDVPTDAGLHNPLGRWAVTNV